MIEAWVLIPVILASIGAGGVLGIWMTALPFGKPYRLAELIAERQQAMQIYRDMAAILESKR